MLSNYLTSGLATELFFCLPLQLLPLPDVITQMRAGLFKPNCAVGKIMSCPTDFTKVPFSQY